MYTIYHDLFLGAAPDDVFDAVSKPEHLINWWPLKCSGNPEEGREYNFFFGPEYDWYGTVIKADDPGAFHVKMMRSDEDWDPTSFGFDMEKQGEGTSLQFWHKNWPACNAHFRTASFCWAILLNGLKNYVEKGIIVPFEERN